jgi:hypothetical protein
MAVAKWATPGSRSSNLASNTFNSLANGTAGSAISYDNSTARDLYAAVTVKLGSLTPATGGSITLRVYAGDGTDTPDLNGGPFDSYVAPLTTTTTGAKVAIIPMVRLYPFPVSLQVVNNAGVSTAASGNELYVRPYNEEVT